MSPDEAKLLRRKAISARGGKTTQARKWQGLCVCGHAKISHWRLAHPHRRQTGCCKDCQCQEFRRAP